MSKLLDEIKLQRAIKKMVSLSSVGMIISSPENINTFSDDNKIELAQYQTYAWIDIYLLVVPTDYGREMELIKIVNLPIS